MFNIVRKTLKYIGGNDFVPFHTLLMSTFLLFINHHNLHYSLLSKNILLALTSFALSNLRLSF